MYGFGSVNCGGGVVVPGGATCPMLFDPLPPTSPLVPPVVSEQRILGPVETMGLSVSTIPWWGWALGGGLALLAFGGKR